MPFDRVLVDAPCSGLGVLGRRADARWRKGPEVLREMPPIQLELLIAGGRRARPGGVLVYSVCSFEPEETDGRGRAIPPAVAAVRARDRRRARCRTKWSDADGFMQRAAARPRLRRRVRRALPKDMSDDQHIEPDAPGPEELEPALFALKPSREPARPHQPDKPAETAPRPRTHRIRTFFVMSALAMLAFATGLLLFNICSCRDSSTAQAEVRVPDLTNLTLDQAEKQVSAAAIFSSRAPASASIPRCRAASSCRRIRARGHAGARAPSRHGDGEPGRGVQLGAGAVRRVAARARKA